MINYLCQTGTKDCFPTCFCNAMLHFGIEIIPALSERLAIFSNGLESCTIYAPQERLERYDKSIHKFISEWNWAERNKNNRGSNFAKSEEWAKYLLESGISIEVRNGPIEHKKEIINALAKNKIAICEIWMPSAEIKDSKYKHAVLITGLKTGKLLIHDPLIENSKIQFNSEKIEYKKNELGTNLEIDSDYFFNDETNPMKPKPNPSQSDYGYRSLILAKSK